MADEPVQGFEDREIVDPRQAPGRLQFTEPTPDPVKPPEATVAAVAGGDDKPPDPPAPPPYERPLFAAFDQIPKREYTIVPPPPYNNLEIVVWINPSDAEVNARTKAMRHLGDFLAGFILRWNLKDEHGNEMPINGDSLTMFPKDLWDWFYQEYADVRNRPLVPPKSDTTTKNQTPRAMNRNPSPNSNSSTG
jgi:hypothetical protein